MRFYPLRRLILFSVVTLLTCAMASFALAAAPPKPKDTDYRIGPGDIIEISVWKNPDLTRTVAVLPDGQISFPLLGPLPAAGKTVSELSASLRKRLNRYAPDVDLSVIVAQVNSMMIYVIGKVQKPGRYALNTNVTVMQALAIAGGLNPFAKPGDIKIFREGHSDKYLRFDYDQVSKGKQFKQNILLRRGDLVVVP